MHDDEDFDLEELIISAHSVKGTPEQDKKIDEFESDMSKGDIDIENLEEELGSVPTDEIPDEIDFSKEIALNNLEEENQEIDISPSTYEPPKKSGDIFEFGKLVLEEIAKRNLPPTPENYKIYFHQLLQTQSEAFQDAIFDILDKESNSKEEERKEEIENTLQETIKLNKQLLALTAKIYENISIMRNIAHQRDEELNDKSVHDVVRLLKFDLNKLESVLGKQQDSMKNLYSRTASAVNSIYENTIYDDEFEVYNRKYFIDALNDEIEKMGYFQHHSSIALIIPHRRLTAKYLTPKVANIILKTIARILKESFRRTDTVAYYGNGIFGVLITHSTLEESEDKIIKFNHRLKESALYVGDKKIDIRVKVGISELLPTRKVQESITKALEALQKANKSETSLYKIVR